MLNRYLLALIIIVISPICLAMTQEEYGQYVSETYDFSPQDLSKEERERKSKTLDEFWDHTENSKDDILPMLRKELKTDKHKPFFYYDGAALLLFLSKAEEDKKLFLQSIIKTDLKDLQHTNYLYRVHALAIEGYDTSEAAFHILSYPNFKAFIPQHALTLGQDYSLIYMLLPTSESFYLDKLIARLQVETDEVALRSVLLSLWYTVTEKGHSAIESFIKNGQANTDIIQFAKELLDRNKTAPHSESSESYETIKEQRNKALGRISDEALYELNSYTKDLIGKLNEQ